MKKKNEKKTKKTCIYKSCNNSVGS